MRTRSRKSVLALATVAVVALILGACAPVMSGGGWFIGQDEESRGNISFDYNLFEDHFEGNYQDRGSSDFGHLRLKFTGLQTGFTGEEEALEVVVDQCMGAVVHYESQDRRNAPGSGVLALVACAEGTGDDGHTVNNDQFEINVLSGPYAGYEHHAQLEGGEFVIPEDE